MDNLSNRKRACVMIVEQDLDVGMKLADHLAIHGYQPVVVRSIDAAFDKLSAVHPRVIFLGLQAPEPELQMNAGEVLLIVQTMCPLVPVVTIAGQINEDLTQVVLRKGARRFVVKPVEFSQIGEVLQSELSAATVIG